MYNNNNWQNDFQRQQELNNAINRITATLAAQKNEDRKINSATRPMLQKNPTTQPMLQKHMHKTISFTNVSATKPLLRSRERRASVRFIKSDGSQGGGSLKDPPAYT